LWLGVAAPLLSQTATASSTLASRTSKIDPQAALGLERFYNLDSDKAVQILEKCLERHPDDPASVNRLLTAVMYREIYRMGLMNPSEYANDSFLTSAHRPADPKVTARIKQLVSRAEQLEDARLSANPNDVDALYARGITRAQFSAYTGLVERAWISALRNAVGARHDHERVLELDPSYTEAKLVVGAHNYVMGSLPLPVKLAVSMVGLSGDKAKGLAYLAEVANSQAENHADAEIAWALFLRREKRYNDALVIDRSLNTQFPQNVIFAVEEGSLLRALSRNADAEASYRKVWQDGRSGKYGSNHYEFAALYLGDLLRSEKRYAEAADAYASVNQVANADPEVLQKANLGAGEMYDRASKRDLAVKSYTAAINVDDSNGLAELARRRLKEPYGQD
jgi:tetratricopeptide (TPR) repeat protein